MSCGAGKSITALFLASHEWRERFCIVVHTTALLSQWQSLLTHVLPHASVATLTAGNTEWEDEDCLLATVQTLRRALKSWPQSERARFSRYVLIVDEAHHVPARTFARVVELSHNRRRMGLSATPERADGLNTAAFVGDICFTYTRRQCVRILQPSVPAFDYTRDLTDPVQRTNALAESEARCGWLCSLFSDGPLASKRVLVLSSRVNLLSSLHERLGGTLISGATSPADRHALLSGDGLVWPVLASLAIAKEGLDLPQANALLFGTPPGRAEGPLKQCVGRVTRREDAEALVIDPVDTAIPILAGQAAKRRQIFKSLGWTTHSSSSSTSSSSSSSSSSGTSTVGAVSLDILEALKS